jgi:hypothetical protein
MKDYSQHGESNLLNELINKIGTENKFCVEFGASDGYWFSNVRMFLDMGWQGLQMEGSIESPVNGVKKEYITKENINELFKKYNVPHYFDILSIDIDGNDYWVWKEIKNEPNVVIIEYNSNFSKSDSYVLEYDPNQSFDGSYAYSASFLAMKKLGEEKGYYLYSENSYCNLIFVHEKFKSIAPSIFNEDNLILPHNQHTRDLKGKRFLEI